MLSTISRRVSRRVAALCACTLAASAASVLVASSSALAVAAPLDPSFSTWQSSTTRAFSLVPTSADLNGDGRQDIVTGFLNSGFLVELGKGDGTFYAGTLTAKAGAGYAPAVGDINNDGKPDIYVRSFTGGQTSQVFWGVGDGTFTAGPTYAASPDYYTPVLSDFDKDGSLDLALPTGNLVRLYKGDGAGAFALSKTISTGTAFPYSGVSADMNGDGFQDLVLAGYSTGVTSVLLSDGAGAFGFRAMQQYPGPGAMGVGVGDLNGDGHPDIARAGTSNIDALLFNPATGAFTTTVLSSDPENQGTSVADFNGDGYADIATVQQLADGSAYNEVFYLNDGSGAFTLSVNMYSAGFTYTQHVADFNNDGAPDVLLASDNDLNTVFTNTTAPSAPAVLAQPVDRIVNNGSTTTFTATATGKPAPTVRWQQLSTASGAVFTDIAGATSGSYSVLAAPALDGYQYHAVFTNGSGAATTNAATLTLNDYAAIVGSQTGSGTVTAGDPANFSVVGYGKPAPTVQWRVSTDGGTTFGDIAGATSTTYSFTTTYADNGNRYLAVLTNTGGTASSTASTLTVSRRVPAVASQPVSAVVNPGDTASFTSSVSADPAATVQWQVSSDGVTFTNVADATTTTLTFTASASMTGNAYRAVFTNGFAESATSNAATLTVNLPPAVVSVTPAVVSAAPATAYGVPTIQLDATTIGYGERTRLTGSTRPNTLVNIYGYTRPDTTYDRLAQVRSDATGRFVFTTVFAANSRLYVIVPRLGRSRLVAENVRSTLTFKATKTAANRYVFTGRVRPVHAGQHVTIYYRTARGGKVILVRTDADVDGNYRVSRTVYAFGQRGYTVFAHVDSGVVLLGNNSRDLGISTYRAPR